MMQDSNNTMQQNKSGTCPAHQPNDSTQAGNQSVVECNKEAAQCCLDGTFSEEKVAVWDERLKRVFNRGFWNGYYLGQRLGEWSKQYGSNATTLKVYIGKGIK